MMQIIHIWILCFTSSSLSAVVDKSTDNQRIEKIQITFMTDIQRYDLKNL